MYTLKWGIPTTELLDREITDEQYFKLSPSHALLYKRKDEYRSVRSPDDYPQAPNPDGGSWPDYSPPSDDQTPDNSIDYSIGSDTGDSFDFGGGDGGGGGVSGDW